MNTKIILSFVALMATAQAFAAGGWEEKIIEKLAHKELTFFGIDADVRRLLNDTKFETDVRQWWQVVNPYYADDANNGVYLEESYPETARWAKGNDLITRNNEQFEMRKLFARHMDAALPSEKAQIYFAYFLRTNQSAKAKSLLRIYTEELGLFGAEMSESPRLKNITNPTLVALSKNRSLAEWTPGAYANCLKKAQLGAIGNCLVWEAADARILKYISCVDKYKGLTTIPAVASCMVQSGISFGVKPGSNGLASLELGGQYSGPSHVVSRTGYLAADNVQYFTENRHDAEIVGLMEKYYAGDSNPFQTDFRGLDISISGLEQILIQGKYPFDSPSFKAIDSHPAFQNTAEVNERNSIFGEIARAIRSAKHTIFIDMFFFGGTMGSALARELIARAGAGVKVYLLHDPYNAFDYKSEMEPVFNTLLAYSKKYPNRMVAAGSYIMAHRTGMPRYFDAIFPDHVVDALSEQSRQVLSYQIPLFPKAKSDHSKVMVLDGAGFWSDSLPVAYVGSKNWTDSSGAMTFDDLTRVAGPAAVAVQDSYYWDFWYALRNGGSGRPAMGSTDIERTLTDFDPLARRWDAQAGRVVPTRLSLARVSDGSGAVTVRIGENNIDGSVLSTLDQDIVAIRSAKSQIIINDQFLYDRRIVEEIIDRAERNPSLQIYIMLEPISKSSGQRVEVLGGFPNTLYGDLLIYKNVTTSAGTKVVARPNVHMRWKFIPESDEFHFEYHMKTITVDGFDAGGRRVTSAAPAVLISGSANKDHMTMHGAFREMQVEIYDATPCSGSGERMTCGAVAEADRVFWERWENEWVAYSPYLFSIPTQVQEIHKKMQGRPMSQNEFLGFARSLIHGAYDLEILAEVE